MLHRKRGGFTLIELLVVVVVVGMLVAILVPAVNSARESARQAKCMNNVKELSTAIFAYTTTTDRYPGHTNPNGHGWVVVILAQLGNQDLWEQCRGDSSAAPSVKLVPAVCPNDETFKKTSNPDTLSYGVNLDICPDRSDGSSGVLATDVKNTTKTILLGEMAPEGHNNKWHHSGAALGFTWDTNNKVKNCLSSQHPTTVTVGFCDGHAKRISKEMDCIEYFGNADSLTPAPATP